MIAMVGVVAKRVVRRGADFAQECTVNTGLSLSEDWETQKNHAATFFKSKNQKYY